MKISRETAILFFVTFFVGQSVSLISPLLPAIRDEFNLSYATVSFVLALFGLSRLVTSLPVGYLYHKVSSKMLLLTGIALILAGSLLAFVSRTFTEFLLSQIIIGVGFSFCVTTIVISLSLSAGKESRGTVLGFNTMARSSSSMAAPVIAGFIASVFLWRSVFAFYMLMALFTFALSWMFVRRRNAVHAERASRRSKSDNRYALMSMMLTGFVASFSAAGFRATIVPLFAKDVLMLDITAIGVALGVSAAMHFIAAPLAAMLSDRYGRKRFMMLGLSVQFAGLAYFLFVSSFSGLLISMALLGIGTMIFVLPPAVVGDISSPARMGRNQSTLRFVIDLGFFAGPFALGIVLDAYGFYATALATMALTLLTAAAVLYSVKETERKINWKRYLGLEED